MQRDPDELHGQHAGPDADPSRRQRRAEEEVPRLAHGRADHGLLRHERALDGQRRRRHAVPRHARLVRRLRPQRDQAVDHERLARLLLRHLRDRGPGAQAQGHRRVHRRALATRRPPRPPRGQARAAGERHRSRRPRGRPHPGEPGARSARIRLQARHGDVQPDAPRHRRRGARPDAPRARRVRRLRARAKVVRCPHRSAPARAGDARRDAHPDRGDRAARAQGLVEPRQGLPRRARLGVREGLRSRRGYADGDRRRAGLRRVRVRQGLPGRKADARREDPADLRGHAAQVQRIVIARQVLGK